jgi:8-oxo-dGTP diphosphatase
MKSWPRCWCATAECCCATAPLVGDGTQMYGTGGHVEDRESPIKALARELEEELGILIQQPGPELVRVVEPGFVLRIWLVERWVGDPVNASPAEHDDLGWFDVSQVADLPLAHSGYLSLIRDTLARLAPL